MKNIFRHILILIFLAPFFLAGQDSFTIHHKIKLSKTKELKYDRFYTIKTTDTIYFDKKIISFTDTSLKITKRVPTHDSEMTIKKYSNPLANDTIYYRVWRVDTFDVAFRKIISMEKFVFESRKWLEPFGYFAIGSALGTVLIPIIAIAEGPGEAAKAAVPILSILAVSSTVIFIGTRKIKYNMRDNWSFIGTKATTR